MKKICLFTLLASIIMLALFLLVGCDVMTRDNIASISLKDHNPDTVIEISAGAFDFSSYTVVITYESGNTEEVTLNEDMINPADRVKFYQVGDHDITISFSKKSYVFKISVKRLTFGNISFPENNVFTYDGTEHVVEVVGDIPANAIVTYLGSNSFINAGTYDLSAVISCEGYVTAKLSTTVKIERARYDMSGVQFEAKEFVYDGTAHSVAISGELPEGVSEPTYTINDQVTSSAIEVGEYTVRAVFANTDPNYETIPDMETTLKIIPAEHSVNDIELVFKQGNGKVIEGNKKTYDGVGVTFDIKDYSELSKNVSVSFSVYDQGGKLISSSNQNTNIVNAGVYTIKVEFTLADSKNYKPIEPITSTFEIRPADYPIGNISLSSDYFIYDGKAHSIAIDGVLPEGVSVTYEYYLDDILLVDEDKNPVQSVTDAGNYTVKAKFSLNDENYKPIPELSARIKIEKIKIDAATLGLTKSPSAEYSGKPYDPGIMTWKEVNGTDYDVLQYGDIEYYALNDLGEYVKMEENKAPIEVGSYRFVITISVADEYAKNYALQNNETSQTYSIDFDIQKKVLAEPVVTFEGAKTTVYTGEPREVKFNSIGSLDHLILSTEYFKLEGTEYVALGANEIPTDAGLYRFVVKISIADEDQDSYVLQNGGYVEEFSMDIEIRKAILEVPKFSFDGNESTIIYNTEAQDVEFTYTAHSEHITVRSTYLRLDGDKYVDMGEGNIPTGIGVYKFVVTASINDTENFIFSNENTRIEASFDFEIKPLVLEVPQISFEGNESTIIYNAEAQDIEFTCTAHSEYITVSKTYLKLEGEEYVEMVEGNIPTGVGVYKCVVKATVNDINCILANDEMCVESFFEFEIKPLVLEVPQISFEGNEATIIYNTEARDIEFTCTAHSEYITVSKTYLKLEGEEYVDMGEGNIPTGVGVYKCVVKATVNDINCILANDEMCVESSFEFAITPLVLEVPEFTFTSGKTLTYNGAEQPATFECSVESEFIDISVSYKRYSDGAEIDMDTEHPLHVSSYECIVTATLNDPNCIFADGSDKVESDTFEYSIHTYVIDVADLGICETYDPDNMPEYAYNNCDLKGHALEILNNEEIKKYIDWQIVPNIIGTQVSMIMDNGEYLGMDCAVNKGTYTVTYKITVLNSSSCALLVNGEKVTEHTVTHYFKIDD